MSRESTSLSEGRAAAMASNAASAFLDSPISAKSMARSQRASMSSLSRAMTWHTEWAFLFSYS